MTKYVIEVMALNAEGNDPDKCIWYHNKVVMEVMALSAEGSDPDKGVYRK